MGNYFKIIAILLIASNLVESVVYQLRKAADKEYPYMVSVQEFTTEKNYFVHVCGGFFVTMEHVITTAHCVVNASHFYRTKRKSIVPQSTTFLSLSAGSIYVDPDLSPEACRNFRDSQRRRIKEISFSPNITTHPSDDWIFLDDIALLVAEKPFKYTMVAQPIKFIYGTTVNETESLYTKYQATGQWKKCFLTGWGFEEVVYDRYDKKMIGVRRATVLNVMNAKMLEFDICKQFWCTFDKKYCNKMDFRVDNMICARGAAQSTPCDGDSGSPYVCEGSLVGMLSFLKDRHNCGPPDRPDGYVSGMRIFQFLRYKHLTGLLTFSHAPAMHPFNPLIVFLIAVLTQ